MKLDPRYSVALLFSVLFLLGVCNTARRTPNAKTTFPQSSVAPYSCLEGAQKPDFVWLQSCAPSENSEEAKEDWRRFVLFQPRSFQGLPEDSCCLSKLGGDVPFL